MNAPPRKPPGSPDHRVRIVVVGASAGGPQALTHLLGELPSDLPVPIAIVLHMPVGATAGLAARLNETCALRVVEASSGTLLRSGLVVIGRAGQHMKLVGSPDMARVHLDVVPTGTAHCPSVDVLFATAARAYGSTVLGVVLTGMGEDGLAGARAIRSAGGRIMTEAESSCAVYGMPRAVAEAGLSDEIVALDGMAKAIQRAL